MRIKQLYTLFILIALASFANAQSRYASHSKLATGKWVKIRVKDEGVYQLTASSLKKMGFSNPDKVSLYGYNVPVLQEQYIEDIDDDLTEIPLYRRASDGALLFYSCGTTQWKHESESMTFTHFNNPYSNYIYYFLTENDAPAKLEQKDAKTSSPYVQKTYYAHALYEKDEFSFINCGRTFFESYDYEAGSRKAYSIPFDNPSIGDVKLAVKFGAAGSSYSSLTVYNGTDKVGTMNFTSLAEYEYAVVNEAVYTLYDKKVNSLNITLDHKRNSGTKGHLDYIRASYEAKLTPTSSKAQFVSFSPNKNNVSGFQVQSANANTKVWNVTSPSSTCELVGTLANDTYTVAADNARVTDNYVVFNSTATFSSPEFVCSVENQDLHSIDSLNLVIIVPANGKLTAQAQRLADKHTQYDGLKCKVIAADKIYNEFSSGTPDATAYRRFMKMIYDKQNKDGFADIATRKKSLNILLFGNCMWDNRLVTKGLTSHSQDDYLLCYESDNSWSHTNSWMLEEYFTFLSDGKGKDLLRTKPDCGVGRITVTSASDAKNVVDKLIQYISNKDAGSWKNTICMLADDGNTNTHMKDADAVLTNTKKLFPDYHYKRIFWDSYTRQQTATGNGYPDAYAEINKTMEEGALIMNYTGHGAAYCLSHEQVLKTSDFKGWTSSRLPLWITAACDVAPIDMNTENLAVEAFINKQGAAMGFIGTTRTVYSAQNRVINNYFMSHVLATKANGYRYTIGEALAQAKHDIISASSYISDKDSKNKAQYVLIGDPAITIATPVYKVKIDKFNGNEIKSDSLPTIAAGETVSIEGMIVDENDSIVNSYDGTISPLIFDNQELIICKNNAGDDVKPYQYYDRTRKIYAGSDSITSGRFKFTFPVPLDINYSNESGIIYMHAVTRAKDREAHGVFNDFLVGGTSPLAEGTDTIGPKIQVKYDGFTLNGQSFADEKPTFYITIADTSGINTTGNGLGHDIVAMIDNNESTTFNLNNYYKQKVGDYTSGEISFKLPIALPAGKHNITVRAFDTLNNMGESSYGFNVYEGLVKETRYYDMSGRMVSTSRENLPKGVYVRQVRVEAAIGTITTKEEKIVITQ